MNLLHIVPHIDDEAAGPSYAVPRLCESLAARGNEVELSCLAARGAIPGVRLDVHRQWSVLDRFAVSTSLAWALCGKADRADIVHNHSLWSMVNVAAGWSVPGRRARLVTSPHGTLSLWALARKRRLKQVLWPFQRRALSRADLLHATSGSEYADIRRLGLRAPVAVIGLGIDLPALRMKKAAAEQRTMLFLGRIHPVKGIDCLLEAWTRLQEMHPDWRLVFVGRGEPEHERRVHESASRLKLQRVEFLGPLYGRNKSEAYWGADLFVLPTHSENFGVVVAEALAHACPVVTTRGAPWARLEQEGCGWWIDHGAQNLVGALGVAMSLSTEQRAAMGRKGRAWMEREYDWALVAKRMEEAYHWLLTGGTPPSFVLLE